MSAIAADGLMQAMVRIILLYGLALAGGVLMLDWIDYKHSAHIWSTEIYVTVVAGLFAALGMWLGNKLTARPRSASFERNYAALESLGISERECEVLDLIAAGDANKVIARKLSISPNTVKTHLARLFEKLEVASRTQAICKARTLDILP